VPALSLKNTGRWIFYVLVVSGCIAMLYLREKKAGKAACREIRVTVEKNIFNVLKEDNVKRYNGR
jgi:hypothetical protein